MMKNIIPELQTNIQTYNLLSLELQFKLKDDKKNTFQFEYVCQQKKRN